MYLLGLLIRVGHVSMIMWSLGFRETVAKKCISSKIFPAAKKVKVEDKLSLAGITSRLIILFLPNNSAFMHRQFR